MRDPLIRRTFSMRIDFLQKQSLACFGKIGIIGLDSGGGSSKILRGTV